MRLAIGLVATVAGIIPQKAEATSGCRTTLCKTRVVRPFNAYLNRVAVCESGRLGHPRWHIATGNGFYGGLQFTLQTWRGVGGKGYPHWYSPLEQKYRAVLVLRTQGRGAWPRCG